MKNVIVPQTKQAAKYWRTGLGGVSKGKQEGTFQATIKVGEEWIHLGYFTDLDMAAYRFNLSACENDLCEFVFDEVEPCEEALLKWRNKNDYNITREQDAHFRYNQYLKKAA